MKKDYKFDPNAIMKYGIMEPIAPIYAITEPGVAVEEIVSGAETESVSEDDVEVALERAAKKRFKWHVVLDPYTFKSFDTKEDVEKYLNEFVEKGLEVPEIIFWGEVQKTSTKIVVIPEED